MQNDELYHHGIKGMKWGVRRTPAQLGYRDGDSAVTKRVKRDYNSMDDQEFKSKYKTSKKTYAKRVAKYGDPYMNSPLAKAGKKLADRDDAKTKKRVSKEYKKASIAGDNALAKKYEQMYVESYNKAANKMNSGGIEKFNKSQEKKYGKDYAKRSGYEDDYMAMFSKEVERNMSKSVLDFRAKDVNYQKADALVKKYDMTKWDDLAKSNQEAVDYFRNLEKKR